MDVHTVQQKLPFLPSKNCRQQSSCGTKDVLDSDNLAMCVKLPAMLTKDLLIYIALFYMENEI